MHWWSSLLRHQLPWWGRWAGWPGTTAPQTDVQWCLRWGCLRVLSMCSFPLKWKNPPKTNILIVVKKHCFFQFCTEIFYKTNLKVGNVKKKFILSFSDELIMSSRTNAGSPECCLKLELYCGSITLVQSWKWKWLVLWLSIKSFTS